MTSLSRIHKLEPNQRTCTLCHYPPKTTIFSWDSNISPNFHPVMGYQLSSKVFLDDYFTIETTMVFPMVTWGS